MINGKCPTWFVVKWLEKHPTHTAKAPECEIEREVRASYVASFGCVRFEHFCGFWRHSEAIACRSDWTIYNERGKRVRFRKRKPRMFVPTFGTLTVRSGIRIVETLKALDKPIDVFIRERSR